MKPALFRIGKGFPVAATSAIAVPQPLLAATAAQANLMASAAPLAITLGAAAFGLGVMALAILQRRRNEASRIDSSAEAAELRAQLDQYEALMSTMPEVTVIWLNQEPARVVGDVALVCGPHHNARDVIFPSNWLVGDQAEHLQSALHGLLERGVGFDISVKNLQGKTVRAVGRPTGTGAALRLRLAADTVPAKVKGVVASARPDQPEANGGNRDAAETLFAAFPKPAWIRDGQGKLIFVNQAYRLLLADLGIKDATGNEMPELFTPDKVRDQLGRLSASGQPLTIANPLPERPEFELTMFALAEGTAGYLGRAMTGIDAVRGAKKAHVPGVIEALGSPVAVFSADGELVHFNPAYARLWNLDEDWLRTPVTERQILDRLRAADLLPPYSNFQEWRAEHLKNYEITKVEERTWHLPDGRTISYSVAPASSEGGVIYVFDDMTERLALESEKKELVSVQRETLNALNEGVAVFATDGRLTLHNPRISAIWKLPLNALGRHPHINALVEAMDKAFPEDGKRIWADLRDAVINLSPQRKDRAGRIDRSDGTLIDYAATHLPDGQTMLSFVDVTHSANYERMLTERNEALMVADRLKDAFVQSVSYELRSPLTNIIGFADLLASEATGPLTEKQRQYTDYIRASSSTLSVLIDNILDLTNVDAGIAQLDIAPHHIEDLVNQAKAGLEATFLTTGGQQTPNLDVQIAANLPVIHVDGKRVVQVLYNLLSNATKFSAPGSRISLHAEKAGDFLRISVEDEGLGIPSEVRAALYEGRAGRPRDGRQRGVGIGLTIAQSFVELHGGRISIHDREPKGSRVTVTLPIASQVAQPAE